MCSMAGKLGQLTTRRTSEPDEFGHTEEATMGTNGKRMDDLVARTAGAAHHDAHPDAVEAARRYGTTDRTQRRWWQDGPPVCRDFGTYILQTDDPYRWVAHVKTTAKVRYLDKLTDEELVERFHELRQVEKATEGSDNCMDCRRGVDWLDRATEKERDASVNEELAACCRLFAARGISEEEVLG